MDDCRGLQQDAPKIEEFMAKPKSPKQQLQVHDIHEEWSPWFVKNALQCSWVQHICRVTCVIGLTQHILNVTAASCGNMHFLPDALLHASLEGDRLPTFSHIEQPL